MGLDPEVTYRLLTLGSRDSETGWYEKIYVESTIKMPIVPRGTTFTFQGVGYYARLDALGFTADPVEVGSQIKTKSGTYYEVKGVKPHYWLDSFMFREVDLAELPLHELI